MARHDLYSPVHKAVRTLCFEAVSAVGRTDFRRASEIPAALAAMRRMLRLARLHAEHEDRAIHPRLHRLAPELAADLEAGHDRHEGLQRELGRDLDRLEIAGDDAARVSLGRRVHERLQTLVADEITHMALEETRANRVLWAHLSDEELAGVHAEIVSGLSETETSEWLEAMLPAVTRAEGVALLAAVLAAVPAERVPALVAPARVAVGEPAFSRLVAEARALGQESAQHAEVAS